MPYYEYQCPVCQTCKELWRKMSERKDPVHCDHDGELMHQVIGGAPAVRKGAGLYSMDSASSDKWGDYDG